MLWVNIMARNATKATPEIVLATVLKSSEVTATMVRAEANVGIASMSLSLVHKLVYDSTENLGAQVDT
jgi:hypothetical protein